MHGVNASFRTQATRTATSLKGRSTLAERVSPLIMLLSKELRYTRRGGSIVLTCRIGKRIVIILVRTCVDVSPPIGMNHMIGTKPNKQSLREVELVNNSIVVRLYTSVLDLHRGCGNAGWESTLGAHEFDDLNTAATACALDDQCSGVHDQGCFAHDQRANKAISAVRQASGVIAALERAATVYSCEAGRFKPWRGLERNHWWEVVLNVVLLRQKQSHQGTAHHDCVPWSCMR